MLGRWTDLRCKNYVYDWGFDKLTSTSRASDKYVLNLVKYEIWSTIQGYDMSDCPRSWFSRFSNMDYSCKMDHLDTSKLLCTTSNFESNYKKEFFVSLYSRSMPLREERKCAGCM